MSNSFVFYSLKIIVELVYEIFYFPVWWYWRGLLNLLIWARDFLINQQKSLALFVWVKNIFKPMFAQYDWQGILISFLVRVAQIIFRGIIMLLWLILALAVILFWILLPIIVIYEISFQII